MPLPYSPHRGRRSIINVPPGVPVAAGLRLQQQVETVPWNLTRLIPAEGARLEPVMNDGPAAPPRSVDLCEAFAFYGGPDGHHRSPREVCDPPRPDPLRRCLSVVTEGHRRGSPRNAGPFPRDRPLR